MRRQMRERPDERRRRMGMARCLGVVGLGGGRRRRRCVFQRVGISSRSSVAPMGPLPVAPSDKAPRSGDSSQRDAKDKESMTKEEKGEK